MQFLAKDNVPFHAVCFPATLLGSGLPFKLVDTIKGFNWLTFEGGKFSTSAGHGIFTDTALALANGGCTPGQPVLPAKSQPSVGSSRKS